MRFGLTLFIVRPVWWEQFGDSGLVIAVWRERFDESGLVRAVWYRTVLVIRFDGTGLVWGAPSWWEVRFDRRGPVLSIAVKENERCTVRWKWRPTMTQLCARSTIFDSFCFQPAASIRMKYSFVPAHNLALAVVRPPPDSRNVCLSDASSIEVLIRGEYYHPQSRIELDLQEHEPRLSHHPSWPEHPATHTTWSALFGPRWVGM